MSSIHTCTRDSCQTAAANGPKLKCIKCNKTFYLFCYGFEKCGHSGIKFSLPNGLSFAIDPNKLMFTCNVCDDVFLVDAINSAMEKTVTQITNTPSKQTPKEKQSSTPIIINPISNAELKKEIMSLKKLMNNVNQSLNVHSEELSEIKQCTKDTNVGIKLLNDNRSVSNVHSIPNIPPSQQTSQPLSFSQIMRQQNTDNRTNKRSANEMNAPSSSKPKHLPKQKECTRAIENKLKAATPTEPKVRKPKFDNAIHVSRIQTSVTLEDMTNYIIENAKMKPDDEFKCTLLVKKDKDLSTLSFVSYKIDVIADKFNQLMDVSFWPRGLLIREFVPQERIRSTLGDFLSTSATKESTQMNKLHKQNEKNSSTPTDSTTEMNQIPSTNQTETHQTIETQIDLTTSSSSIDMMEPPDNLLVMI